MNNVQCYLQMSPQATNFLAQRLNCSPEKLSKEAKDLLWKLIMSSRDESDPDRTVLNDSAETKQIFHIEVGEFMFTVLTERVFADFALGLDGAVETNCDVPVLKVIELLHVPDRMKEEVKASIANKNKGAVK